MLIKMRYVAAHGDEGEHYSYEYEAEVHDEDHAREQGREFARLCLALGQGANEGFTVALRLGEDAE